MATTNVNTRTRLPPVPRLVVGVREGVFDEALQHGSSSRLGLQEMDYMPSLKVRLKWWEYCFVLPYKVAKSFVCCAWGEADEWRHETLAKRQVHSMIDDDWEFSDLAQYAQHHLAIRELSSEESKIAMRESLEEQYTKMWDNYQNQPVVIPSVTTLAVRTPVFVPSVRGVTARERDFWVMEAVDAAMEVLPHQEALTSGLARPRKRRRVVAGCVVALINKVRTKYFELRHTEANRRMVASYLMKLMREHHFRSCDIHLHVKYAVDVYFELQGGGTVRQAANRC